MTCENNTDIVAASFFIWLFFTGPAFFLAAPCALMHEPLSDDDKTLWKLAKVALGLFALASAQLFLVLITAVLSPTAFDHTSTISSERAIVTLTHIEPPKHVYVSFRDEELFHEEEYYPIGKHMNRWRELELGSDFPVTRKEVVTKRGWLVEKLALHKWPLLSWSCYADNELGKTEYRYEGVREGIYGLLENE